MIPDELNPIETFVASDGGTAMRVKDKAEMCAALSDLSVLVQIPEVRELVLELRCAYQGDTSGRKIMQPWIDALEATS